MKKCFVITMFGSPFEWTQKYINHVQYLEQAGWYWKIFTPNKIESKGNVEVVPMTIEQFNDLVQKKLGVRPNLSMTEAGIPSVHITDFYIFSGVVFEDYLKGFDFWGITNFDVVYGRLDSFISDSVLQTCDVFSDDVNTFNGVFSLLRNREDINNLFRHLKYWKEVITQPQCGGCLKLPGQEHTLFGSDEYGMTDILRSLGGAIRFKYPKYYPLLSHDRLEQHVPVPMLDLKEDHTLWELFKDTRSPNWEHARPTIGKEIPYFHFSETKRWPL